MIFGLVSEGVSEHKIIEHIISRYFKDNDPIINYLEPMIENNKQVGSGGFQQVLKYCKETQKITNAFQYNEYLIIQIDTDKIHEPPLNISLTKFDSINNVNSIKKESEELYEEVFLNLKNLIEPQIISDFSDRIIFAICIDTIECWLLPIYNKGKKKPHETNCLKKLNHELDSKEIHIITGSKNSPNSQKTYDIILSNLNRKKDIENWSKYNVGFQRFIESLPKIEVKEASETEAETILKNEIAPDGAK